MATHSSTFAWKIPWVEEPGSLFIDLESEVTERWRIMYSCSLVFFNWTKFSSGREAQIHPNMDEKIHCLCKRKPFLKTAAK